jgi:hypothetical protein
VDAGPLERGASAQLPPPPKSFVCPITQELMSDPVMCVDGHTYDRSAIELWLQTNQTSPSTGASLPSTELTANHSARMAIDEWKAASWSTEGGGSEPQAQSEFAVTPTALRPSLVAAAAGAVCRCFCRPSPMTGSLAVEFNPMEASSLPLGGVIMGRRRCQRNVTFVVVSAALLLLFLEYLAVTILLRAAGTDDESIGRFSNDCTITDTDGDSWDLGYLELGGPQQIRGPPLGTGFGDWIYRWNLCGAVVVPSPPLCTAVTRPTVTAYRLEDYPAGTGALCQQLGPSSPTDLVASKLPQDRGLSVVFSHNTYAMTINIIRATTGSDVKPTAPTTGTEHVAIDWPTAAPLGYGGKNGLARTYQLMLLVACVSAILCAVRSKCRYWDKRRAVADLVTQHGAQYCVMYAPGQTLVQLLLRLPRIATSVVSEWAPPSEEKYIVTIYY